VSNKLSYSLLEIKKEDIRRIVNYKLTRLALLRSERVISKEYKKVEVRYAKAHSSEESG
jgi:hypothetical protein